VHNLISGSSLHVEHVISDYLDEYPEDLERLRGILEKAHSVVTARGDNDEKV
jgi:hypothetical protein